MRVISFRPSNGNLWADPDVMRRLPAVLATNDRIINGAKNHFSHVKDKMRTVRDGEKIVSGVRVIDTPGHTQGHISVEIAGGDGLVVVADALTHAVISFQHPSWPVPVDHEPDRSISTRLRLLDRLVIDKRRLIGAQCRSLAPASSSARMAPIALFRLEARAKSS